MPGSINLKRWISPGLIRPMVVANMWFGSSELGSNRRMRRLVSLSDASVLLSLVCSEDRNIERDEGAETPRSKLQ